MDAPDTYQTWTSLRTAFATLVKQQYAKLMTGHPRQDEMGLTFALGRLTEAEQLAIYFRQLCGPGPLRIVDVGAGIGGTSLGLANVRANQVSALDVDIFPEFRSLQRSLALPIALVVGTAAPLPFADSSLDVVLCLETLEHLPDPQAFGREAIRVLKPNGYCMLTTPARLKHLFKPDPHFGIRGLLFLPDRWQATLVRRTRSLLHPYDVTHIYWHARSIRRLFPGKHRFIVMRNRPYPDPSLFQRVIGRLFRGFIWDRLLLQKLASEQSPTLRSPFQTH